VGLNGPKKPWRELAIALFCAVLIFGFWGTAVSTSWARIAALETIEPYGFAVHEQLLFNFSKTGDFFQTIHLGYDDTWTWSGHRALTLPINGLLYGLSPSPLWLSKIQIFWVLSGVIPAAWLGRHHLKSTWGIALGAFFYLICPATIALALQDYQDLVLATPCLMWTLCAMQAKHWRWVLAGAIVGCLPREECVPLVLAAAMVSFPGTKRAWFRNMGIAAGVAVLYTLALTVLFPLAESQHDMPLVNAFRQVFQWPPQLFLDGWPYLGEFYSLLWAPLGLLALLAPELILPGVALIFLHMTIPWGHGVDRSWGGHIHHMGPVLPFFIAGAILGSCRLINWIQGIKKRPRNSTAILCSAFLVFGLNWTHNWAQYYRLRVSPVAIEPVYTHPAWSLVQDHLSPEDIPIISSRLALAVSARKQSFTYDESLFEKAPQQGLGAGTHLIVDQRNTTVVDWGMAMTGATQVDNSGPYLLIQWAPGALDSQIPSTAPQPLQDARPWLGMPQNRGQIAGVPPRKAPPPPPGPPQGPGNRPFKAH
jgi:hypothetical protein